MVKGGVDFDSVETFDESTLLSNVADCVGFVDSLVGRGTTDGACAIGVDKESLITMTKGVEETSGVELVTDSCGNVVIWYVGRSVGWFALSTCGK